MQMDIGIFGSVVECRAMRMGKSEKNHTFTKKRRLGRLKAANNNLVPTTSKVLQHDRSFPAWGGSFVDSCLNDMNGYHSYKRATYSLLLIHWPLSQPCTRKRLNCFTCSCWTYDFRISCGHRRNLAQKISAAPKTLGDSGESRASECNIHGDWQTPMRLNAMSTPASAVRSRLIHQHSNTLLPMKRRDTTCKISTQSYCIPSCY